MAIKKVQIGKNEWTYAIVKQLNGTYAVVATKPDGSSQALTVSDVTYNTEQQSIQFTCNGQRFSLGLTQSTEQEKQSTVFFANGRSVDIKPTAFKRLQSLFMPATSQEDAQYNPSSTSNTLKSPLAGRVTKILVQAGQPVKQGQALLMIESMKMENEICARIDGTIKTISIQVGDVVKPNQVLLSFG
jgi:biotin carboxyl carrier protein